LRVHLNLFVNLSAILLTAVLAGCNKEPSDDGRAFGVKMEDPVSALADAQPLEEPPLFNFSFRPKEESKIFRQYAALAAPAAGVCAVRGRGVLPTPDSMHDILEPLRAKYGRETYDSTAQGYYWYPSEKNASSTIQVVSVNYFGNDVSLTYTFRNIAACRRELEPKAPLPPPSE
jgi:hypothetical protein